MHPDAAKPMTILWTAVEREDDGAAGEIVHAVAGVRREEERCLLFAFFLTQQQAAGGGGVLDRFAADDDLMGGLDDAFLVMVGCVLGLVGCGGFFFRLLDVFPGVLGHRCCSS